MKDPEQSPKNELSSFIQIAKGLGDLSINEVVPPMFSLKVSEAQKEMMIGEERVYSWRLAGNEELVANLAGWNTLKPTIEDDWGYMKLPNGTRNATSVLSGTEAWSGEKLKIIKTVSDYINDLKDQGLGFDENLSWTGVGITPDLDIFIAPPHNITKLNEVQETQKKSELVEVLDRLLENDEVNREAVKKFENSISEPSAED